MKLLNEKKYKFQCRKCHTEILFSKEDCWVDGAYEDLWLTCPVCGRQHDNQTYRLFSQEYIEEHDDKDKEIERLNNIINELEKWLNEKICLNKNDKDYINGMTFIGVNLQMYQMFLDKLQELKGSD